MEAWERDFVKYSKVRDQMSEQAAYDFPEGVRRKRISTAVGGRGDPGMLDYQAQDGTTSLPNIHGAAIPRRGATSQGSRYQTVNANQNKGPVIRQAEALDENRIVLHKKSYQLGSGYYIVEISSNNSHLFIAAYDLESPESLLIELPTKRAEEILHEFKNDYERMAQCLQVMNKRLVLLNPKFAMRGAKSMEKLD